MLRSRRCGTRFEAENLPSYRSADSEVRAMSLSCSRPRLPKASRSKQDEITIALSVLFYECDPTRFRPFLQLFQSDIFHTVKIFYGRGQVVTFWGEVARPLPVGTRDFLRFSFRGWRWLLGGRKDAYEILVHVVLHRVKRLRNCLLVC